MACSVTPAYPRVQRGSFPYFLCSRFRLAVQPFSQHRQWCITDVSQPYVRAKRPRLYPKSIPVEQIGWTLLLKLGQKLSKLRNRLIVLWLFLASRSECRCRAESSVGFSKTAAPTWFQLLCVLWIPKVEWLFPHFANPPSGWARLFGVGTLCGVGFRGKPAGSRFRRLPVVVLDASLATSEAVMGRRTWRWTWRLFQANICPILPWVKIPYPQ